MVLMLVLGFALGNVSRPADIRAGNIQFLSAAFDVGLAAPRSQILTVAPTDRSDPGLMPAALGMDKPPVSRQARTALPAASADYQVYHPAPLARGPPTL